MTLADIQYLFETASIEELRANLTERIQFGYADILLRQVSAQRFDSAKDWVLLCGIVDYHRRTGRLSERQRHAALIILKKHSNLLVVY